MPKLSDNVKYLNENLEHKSISSIQNLFKFMDTVDETNSSSNVAGYRILMNDIITRYFNESNLEHFVSIVVADTPIGDIPVNKIKVSKKGSSSDKTIFVKFKETTSLKVDDIITGDTSSSTGRIIAIEDTYAMIEVTSESKFTKEQINTNVAEIVHIFPNNWAVGILLAETISSQSTVDAESNRDMIQVESVLEMLKIDCKSESVSVGWTIEYLTDLVNMGNTFSSKERAINMLIESAINVIDTIIKQKVIQYMKDNATVRNVMSLSDSTGAGVINMWGDVYARIGQSKGSIGTNSGISSSYSVLASSSVYNGIESFLGKDAVQKDGYLLLPNGVKMIEDGYSATDYVLVAMANQKNTSAIIYAPHSLELVSAKSAVDFKEYVNVHVRDDMKLNSIVELDDDKSRMMEITLITNVDSVTNF